MARNAVVDALAEREVTIQTTNLQQLWSGSVMEIRRLLYWVGNYIAIVEYNTMTEEKNVTLYEKS